jgi:hypothetical protein
MFTDPSGAALCVWEAGTSRGAELVNEPGAWSMSLLSTPDPDGCRAFYGAVFGWETDAFDTGEGEIALWRVPGYVGGEPEQPVARDVVGAMVPMDDERFPEGTPAHWSIDFWVDDVDATAEAAAALGGAARVPPHDAPGFRQSVLADPHGATFSVSRVSVPA